MPLITSDKIVFLLTDRAPNTAYYIDKKFINNNILLILERKGCNLECILYCPVTERLYCSLRDSLTIVSVKVDKF